LSLGKEQIIQINFIAWFKYTYPELQNYIFHFANERKCSIIEGKILKRMGVKSGVSDVFLAYPVVSDKETKHGLWIEIKTEKGKLSITQKEFLKNMKKVGYATAVAKSPDECKEAIIDYLQFEKF
jgi:hypothetical protein